MAKLTWQPDGLSLGRHELPRDGGRREATRLARQRQVGAQGAVAVLGRGDYSWGLLQHKFHDRCATKLNLRSFHSSHGPQYSIIRRGLNLVSGIPRLADSSFRAL